MNELGPQFLMEVGLGDLSDLAAERVLMLSFQFASSLFGVMSASQFAECDKYVEAGDRDGACNWIKNNIPAYQILLRLELEEIKQELIRLAASIAAIETAVDDCSDYYEAEFNALDLDPPIDPSHEGQ